jgi:sulfur-carrier protein
MAIKVIIPTVLQKFISDQPTIECDCTSVSELIDQLETLYPGTKARLCDQRGRPRQFLRFYVNNEDISFLEDTATMLADGDQVTIIVIPASN